MKNLRVAISVARSQLLHSNEIYNFRGKQHCVVW